LKLIVYIIDVVDDDDGNGAMLKRVCVQNSYSDTKYGILLPELRETNFKFPSQPAFILISVLQLSDCTPHIGCLVQRFGRANMHYNTVPPRLNTFNLLYNLQSALYYACPAITYPLDIPVDPNAFDPLGASHLQYSTALYAYKHLERFRSTCRMS